MLKARNHLPFGFSNPIFATEAIQMRDYLLPNFLAFKSTLKDRLQDRIKEIFLLKNEMTLAFINNNTVHVGIELDASNDRLAILSQELRPLFDEFMAQLGLKAKICFYNDDYIKLAASTYFVEQKNQYGFLVWKHTNDTLLTAQECIESVYQTNSFTDNKIDSNDLSVSQNPITKFILSVPHYDWLNKQKAIQDPPPKHDNVSDFCYSCIISHIKVWCHEFCLYQPDWLKDYDYYEYNYGFDPHNNA